MTELLPTLDSLNRVEKLRVMHYLVTELEKEEGILPPGIYPVWTPFQLLRGRQPFDESLHRRASRAFI